MTSSTLTHREPRLRRRRVFFRVTLAFLLIAELAAVGMLWAGLQERTGFGLLFWTLVVGAALVAVSAFAAGVAALHRRFQFGLKTLLIVVLAVGGGFGWIARGIERTRTQRNAVAKLRALGADVWYTDEDKPGWKTLLGRQYLQDADGLGGGRFTGEDLVHVEKLSGLEWLQLGSPTLDDDDLAHLRNLNKLETLVVSGTRIDGHGLAHLEGLPNLRDLRLLRSSAGDAELACLSNFRQLNTLVLDGPRIGNGTLYHLRKLDQLWELRISRSGISDDGLANLSALRRLRVLLLNGTGVTDAGMVDLEPLDGLEDLSIDSTAVTDAGIVHLKHLTGLRRLRLSCTQVTDAGLADLERALPKTVISR